MPNTNNASATRAQSEAARTQSVKVLLRESGMFERFPHLNDASLPVEDIRLTVPAPVEDSSGSKTRVSMLGMLGKEMILKTGVLKLLNA